MQVAVLLVLLILCGCSTIQTPDTTSWKSANPIPMSTARGTKYWLPSDMDRRQAQDLARSYAQTHLRLKESQVRQMKNDFLAFYRKEQPIIIVGFFDPRFHKPDDNGHYSWPLGGFPTFFSVDVDPINWKVVADYASPE